VPDDFALHGPSTCRKSGSGKKRHRPYFVRRHGHRCAEGELVTLGLFGKVEQPHRAHREDGGHAQNVHAVRRVEEAQHDAVAALGTWSTAAIQEALQTTLVEELGLKPRVAFGPVRVAITGRRVSPPLFESMELLGRERSLARLASAL